MVEFSQTAENEEELEISFSSLILSIGSAILTGLGIIPNLQTGKVEKNLQLAKHNIDLLTLLKKKTKNNLSHEEAELLENILYDGRMKYVQQVSGSGEKRGEKNGA